MSQKFSLTKIINHYVGDCRDDITISKLHPDAITNREYFTIGANARGSVRFWARNEKGLFKAQPRDTALQWNKVENTDCSQRLNFFITVWQPICIKISKIQLEECNLKDEFSELSLSANN